MKNKEIIIPTVVMVLICLVVTLALSGTNLLTEDKIAEIQKSEQDASMKEVMSAEQYEEITAKTDDGDITYYIAFDGETEKGKIFVVTEKGYGGDVKVMCAVNSDGTVAAVKVLDVTNETPGLGQNTGNESFYSQYSGLKSEVTVQKNGADKSKNEINAVTGATISSKAVTRAVNKALEYNGLFANDTEKEAE